MQVSRIGTSPIRVLVCSKDPEERRFIRALLERGSDREIKSGETDQVSEVKLAAQLGKVDVVLIDIDTPDVFGYWLEQVVRNQLAPVVVLTQRWTEEDIPGLLPHGPIGYVFKSGLSRNQLLDAIDSALGKWHALQCNLTHFDELDRLANFDDLTGLANRRSVLRRLEEAEARARRYNEELSVFLVDIDGFGQTNETFGREVADNALGTVAALIKKRTRDADYVGRYGGDEFLIILPHTDKERAFHAAERIRQLIEGLRLKDARGSTYALTVSAGISAYEPGDDVASIIYRAENCLCRAKANGRNRVEK